MTIIIDWELISVPKDFFSQFLPQVKAPEWHGNNLNALNDSLVTGDINGISPPYNIKNINYMRPLYNSGMVEKRMKNTPIKAKNESNSSLFANFLTQSGVFCNFLTHSTNCAKVSIC